jgi:hypothetical protein
LTDCLLECLGVPQGMRGKRGSLGQTCWILLAAACFIIPAHTQQANSEIAQSLQRAVQSLGRQALWTAAAASVLIPGQGAIEGAAQSALQRGTDVCYPTHLAKISLVGGIRGLWTWDSLMLLMLGMSDPANLLTASLF